MRTSLSIYNQLGNREEDEECEILIGTGKGGSNRQGRGIWPCNQSSTDHSKIAVARVL